jgi:hypothetical protein
MSDVDPLIKREIERMPLGVLENRDLSVMVLQRVRRRRIKRVAIVLAGLIVLSSASYGLYSLINGSQGNHGASSFASNKATPDNSGLHPAFTGLISDYPITWEQGVGDTGAISKAGGLGDTLGGLTARGLKVSWERCKGGQCPITWTLAVENETQDIVSVNPALMIYIDHAPVVSSSRPTTVTPRSTAILVFTFPEFKDTLQTSPGGTWQWNWFLTSIN